MKLINRILILAGTLLLTGVGFCLSVEDDEFSATTSNNFGFMKGDGLCFILPNDGLFSSLTDTSKGIYWSSAGCSGSGTVEVTSTGWVNLKCTGPGTASIELSEPVILSLMTTFPRKSYAWDQLAPVMHYRGVPDVGYDSKVAGLFQLELFDAAGRESHPLVGLDFSASALGGYYPKIGLDRFGQTTSGRVWASIAWQFTPPHASWNKISKIRISYTVPAGVAADLKSGIQVGQLYLCSMWCRNENWYPPADAAKLLQDN